jgi:hypothetical protein
VSFRVNILLYKTGDMSFAWEKFQRSSHARAAAGVAKARWREHLLQRLSPGVESWCS